MNIYDIAKKAKVSASTVSRALHSDTRHKVADDTLKKIEYLAEQFSFSPSSAARGLRRSTYDTVGLLVPHYKGVFFSGYYMQLMAGISDALLRSHYRFKLVMLKLDDPWDGYPFKHAEGVDGLIIIYWPFFFSNKAALKRLDVPCTIIGDAENDVRSYFVNADNFGGGEMAARYLHSHGHRKTTVIAGPPDFRDSRLRAEGFVNFFRENDPKSDVRVYHADFDALKVAAAVEQALQERTTAFFCVNDTMAVSVLEKLRQMGVRCPEDVSVMGFDNDTVSQTSKPALTTIHAPVYEIAKDAAERLIDRLSGRISSGDFSTNKKTYPVRFIERESVSGVRRPHVD